jgi:predicted nucleotidyltransferase
MTVIDERSRVPELDSRATERLAAVFERPEVIAGFLIGSRARGDAGPLSDIDIAVIHRDGLGPRERLALRLGLLADAAAALGTEEVDVVLLHETPPAMRHHALGDGVVLFDRDPGARLRFALAAFHEYVDTEPLRRLSSRRLRERIREGRFGRRP